MKMDPALQGMLARLARHKAGEPVGMPSVCSSHPEVIAAVLRAYEKHDGPLLIESTANQVNQFGGYSGMTPKDFTAFVKATAQKNHFDSRRILFGGDHLGTNLWQALPAAEAMRNARELVMAYLKAGYRKLHLDLSFACRDDEKPLGDAAIVERTVEVVHLCEANCGSAAPVYVIGTEVPTPGGSTDEHGLKTTDAADVHRVLGLFCDAFARAGLENAWRRVIALVVQPGVEFGDNFIHHYRPDHHLTCAIDQYDHLVYEAHSTDFQIPENLVRLVGGHFFILKVGPWLTFTLREALFLLEIIEKETVRTNLSRFRQTLIAAMQARPEHWQKYYPADEQLPFKLAFSYSDRARYYLEDRSVKAAQARLYENLAGGLPETLLSQYLPAQYEKVVRGTLRNAPGDIVVDRVGDILEKYRVACGGNPPCGKESPLCCS